MRGVETDGQYEGAACADPTHNHNGLAGSFSAQLQAALDFNKALKARGLYQAGADAYFWSGANRWNHADTDQMTHLPDFWEQLTVGRVHTYNSTRSRLPTSGQMGFSGPGANLQGMPKQCASAGRSRLLCFGFGLAGQVSMGSIPEIQGVTLYDPADPEAPEMLKLLQKWTALFKRHRPLFAEANLVHLRRPDSRNVEAVATLYTEAPPAGVPRGLVTLLNPANATASLRLPVPLYYANLAPGTPANVSTLALLVAAAPEANDEDPCGPPSQHVVGGAGEGSGIHDSAVDCVLPPSTRSGARLAGAAGLVDRNIAGAVGH